MRRVSLCSIGILLLLGCGKHEQNLADAGAILTARTLGLAHLDENRLDPFTG